MGMYRGMDTGTIKTKGTAMGMITIEVVGSFGRKYKAFSAQETGHADAVAQAIEWLSSELLPSAIRNDHKCHDEGVRPNKGFAVRNKSNDDKGAG